MALAASSRGAPRARMPTLSLSLLREDRAEFTLRGTDASVANALRRVMQAEVPIFAIQLVDIWENSSVLHDDFVAHRLGMVPIRWKATDRLPQEEFNMPSMCDCEGVGDMEVCPKCNLELELDVVNDNPDPDGDSISVTTHDLRVITPGMDSKFEIAHFTTAEEAERCKYDRGILLNKLGPGQRIHLRCIAQLGVGKIHAKFNPTATVAMRYVPDIRLNTELLELISPADKKLFVDRCQPHVFRFDPVSSTVALEDSSIANNIDEIQRVGSDIARKYHSSGNIVSVGFVPDTYIYTVEGTGALSAAQIVESALKMLVKKMETVSVSCSQQTSGMFM